MMARAEPKRTAALEAAVTRVAAAARASSGSEAAPPSGFPAHMVCCILSGSITLSSTGLQWPPVWPISKGASGDTVQSAGSQESTGYLLIREKILLTGTALFRAWAISTSNFTDMIN